MSLRYFKSLPLFAAFALNAAGQVPQLATDNISDVVKAMTLDEKVTIVIGYTGGNNYTGLPTQAPEGARELVAGAAGQTTFMPRIGLPHTVVADGPAGLRITPSRPGTERKFYCTAFPTATSLASSWDTDLVYKVGNAMGNEVLEYGCDVLLAPGVNIMRNPLCGRNFEYFSEDPIVAGKIGAAYVNGVQSNGVGVSVKHFAANNQETNRTGNDAIVSQRALREIYLKPFEIIVKESHPWTIMSSYNKLNGPYTEENRELLTNLLREEWGFDGIVMTDWIGLRNTAAQIKAGNDLMMPGYQNQIDDIKRAIKTGELTEADLNKCVERILKYVIKTPRFKGYKYTENPDLKDHALITRQAAADGMVLLKNNKYTLPLTKGSKVALFGNTSYNFVSGGTGSGDVNEAYTIGLDEGLTNLGFKVDRSLAETIKEYLEYTASSENIAAGFSKILFDEGTRRSEMKLSQVMYDAIAQKNHAAIITIGRNAGENADRVLEGDFEITLSERDLLTKVSSHFHKYGKPVIVIINAGGPIETASWRNLADAILIAWQPGQEAGNSVADILVGNVTPSGKLTMTFPMEYSDVPSSASFPAADYANKKYECIEETPYEDGIFVGYRYYITAGIETAYPFGHGLSYTTFKYSGLKVTKGGNQYTATVKITNTGNYQGREAVQLYVKSPISTIERPERELKAFAKTALLQPGQSEIVKLHFSESDLAYYDEDEHSWITKEGEYEALVGSSSCDIRCTQFIKVKALTISTQDILKPIKPLTELSLSSTPKQALTNMDEELVGRWKLDMEVNGYDMKGEIEIGHDGDNWWMLMLGSDKFPVEYKADGSIYFTQVGGGFTTETIIIPIDGNTAKFVLNVSGMGNFATITRIE